MTRAVILGIDPGKTTGVAVLRLYNKQPALVPYQVIYAKAFSTIKKIAEAESVDVLAVERFILSNRVGKAAEARAAVDTMTLIAQLQQLQPKLLLHSAAEVKAWATDRRLLAAGLLTETTSMPHARDAARHAMFTAVKIGWMKDPLSLTEDS